MLIALGKMASSKSLQVGQTVWRVGRQKMGRTRLSRTAVWPITIVEILADGRVKASVNGNPARVYPASVVTRWRVKCPETKLD
jgi:hypothetical protein